VFVPAPYLVPEQHAVDLIRRHPLAILTTNGPRVPFATHLPVIRPPEGEAVGYRDGDAGRGALAGAVLLGHLNRANPHWAALSAGTPGTLIFHGPNSYVSPTVYGRVPAAPTWNFTAVHVHGSLRPVTDRAETLQILTWTVRQYEREFGAGWDMRSSLGYFERIVDGVGAFTFEVTEYQAMFKLSQEQAPEVREKVRQDFDRGSRCVHQDLAEMMGRMR
jgi:transcriptional regulator